MIRIAGITSLATLFLMAAAVLPSSAQESETSRDRAVVGCESCHEETAAWRGQATVHAPFAAGECLDCHSAHASRHGALLRRSTSKTCLGCHEDLDQRILAHGAHGAITEDRQCLACHDPHASPHAALLREPTGQLCVSCHENVRTASGLPHPHRPVANGTCLVCHDPHVSQRPGLVKKDEPDLCAACHNLKDPALARAHKGIPFAGSPCSTCHAPHGSEIPGMIRVFAHEPFSAGMCDACHTPDRATPEAMRAGHGEICSTCHETWNQGHPIPPTAGCLSCHDPHTSAGNALVAGRERDVCLMCHEDIAAAHRSAATTHPTIEVTGDCSPCHAVHEGSPRALLRGRDVQRTCSGCHASHLEFAHPMGFGVIDPSGRREFVDCLSCHDVHGTQFPAMLLASPRRDLCLGCHRTDADPRLRQGAGTAP